MPLDLNLLLQTIKLGLEIFKTILEDIPKEHRQKAWDDWYKMWGPLMERAKSALNSSA